MGADGGQAVSAIAGRRAGLEAQRRSARASVNTKRPPDPPLANHACLPARIGRGVLPPEHCLNLGEGGVSNRFASTMVCGVLTLVGNADVRNPVSTRYTAGNAGVHLIE